MKARKGLLVFQSRGFLAESSWGLGLGRSGGGSLHQDAPESGLLVELCD